MFTLIFVLFLEIFLTIFLIFFWNKNNQLKLISENYTGIQKIHTGSIPRLGGLISYASLFIFSFLNSQSILIKFLILLLPLVIISLKEDLFHNVSAHFRLSAIFISALLILYFTNIDFPYIEIPFIESILDNSFFKLFFMALCLTVLSNGLNIIDGTNGLLNFTVLSQLISLLLFSYFVSDYEVISIIIPIMAIILINLFFNFPYGKIFAGDLGAYFYGFIVGFITIYFFGRNENLLSWNAALILFYPVFEVLFSYIRKIINNHSPFEPDPHHLHLKCFFWLEKKTQSTLKANYLTTLYLFPVWILPFILFLFFHDNLFSILYSLVFMIILYLLIYKIIPKKN